MTQFSSTQEGPGMLDPKSLKTAFDLLFVNGSIIFKQMKYHFLNGQSVWISHGQLVARIWLQVANACENGKNTCLGQ